MLENNINLMCTRKARLAEQKCSVMRTNRERLSIAGLPPLQHLWRKVWYKETLQKNDSTYLPDRRAHRTFSHRFILSCHHVSLVWPHTACCRGVTHFAPLWAYSNPTHSIQELNLKLPHRTWIPFLTASPTMGVKSQSHPDPHKKQLPTQKRLLWKLRALAFFQKFCSWKNVC